MFSTGLQQEVCVVKTTLGGESNKERSHNCVWHVYHEVLSAGISNFKAWVLCLRCLTECLSSITVESTVHEQAEHVVVSDHWLSGSRNIKTKSSCLEVSVLLEVCINGSEDSVCNNGLDFLDQTLKDRFLE